MFPSVTVVIPITERYDPLKSIFESYDSALRRCVADVSYIFVVDGGFAKAGDELEEMARSREGIQVIRLNRAFGESTALSMALDAAKADWILTLPPYLQVEPDSLKQLFDDADDYDLVISRRWPLQGHALNKISNAVFNRVVRSMTGLPFHDLGCSVRLLRGSVVREVPIYGEQHRFLPILASQRGFRIRELSLPQAERDKRLKTYGPSTYAKRFIDLVAVFFLVKFTKRPLRFFGMIGSILIAVGFVVLAVTAFQRLLLSVPLADRPVLLLGLLFVVLGVQLFAVGLIGELIIFVHAKELKEYTVLKRLNFDHDKQQGLQ